MNSTQNINELETSSTLIDAATNDTKTKDDEIAKELELKEDERLQRLVDEMEEDMFETKEEREERLAQKRREERKQKLQKLKVMEKESMVVANTSTSTRIGSPPLAKRTKLEHSNEEGAIHPSNVQNNGLESSHETNHHHETQQEGPLQHDEQEMKDDGIDSFDMFTSSVTPPVKEPTKKVSTVSAATTAGLGLDDAEGYYKASIGETISFTKDDSQKMSFRVLGIIGKGVFSTVLKCVYQPSSSGASAAVDAVEQIVAMKLIRSNETMTKAAMKEVRILRLLQATLTKNQRKKTNMGNHEHFIVRMIESDELGFQSSLVDDTSSSDVSPIGSMLEYHNHTVILFEYFPYNLRETLSKFGKNVGINLSAVRSYSKQLLSALKHLADHRVVHADIKLDNILVSENFSTVKLCDFGSAFFETDTDNVPTPYLVRFLLVE
jgi:serine/threonine-protein kinase PRP4